MKILKGVDELGIEDKCMYVIPEGWGAKGFSYTENDEDKVFRYGAKVMLEKVAEEHGFPLGLFGSSEQKADLSDFFTSSRKGEAGGGGAGGSAVLAGGFFGAVGVLAGVVIGRRGVGGQGYERVADVERNFSA